MTNLEATDATDESTWLAGFHAGARSVLEQCYRAHHAAVLSAASKVLRPVDAETVTHEVFHRLLSSAEMRAAFGGGNMGAWLSRVATNQAHDYRRKYAREEPLAPSLAATATHASEASDADLGARILIDRFRSERLPPKWRAVFEARFIKQLGQREAALALGMHRTTLLYQEHRIRALLKQFVLGEES